MEPTNCKRSASAPTLLASYPLMGVLLTDRRQSFHHTSERMPRHEALVYGRAACDADPTGDLIAEMWVFTPEVTRCHSVDLLALDPVWGMPFGGNCSNFFQNFTPVAYTEKAWAHELELEKEHWDRYITEYPSDY